MDKRDPCELVLPILGLRASGGKTELASVLGTAFSIGRGAFISASHVLSGLDKFDDYGIGYFEGTALRCAKITSYELHEDNDVGFLCAKVPNARTPSWHDGQLGIFNDVAALGYPYAYDSQHRAITVRGFSGHVVGRDKFFRLGAHPQIYELSFQCPKGLSGAPLLIPGNSDIVTGIIIGNQESKMETFRHSEVEEASGNTRTIVTVEGMSLGVALSSESLFGTYSKMLGCSLREHLEEIT